VRAQCLRPVALRVFGHSAISRARSWNLNNLPYADGSLLGYIGEEMNGVNVPWLYYGMLFATFAWHIEDNNFFSMNYMHEGASKTWYVLSAVVAMQPDACCTHGCAYRLACRCSMAAGTACPPSTPPRSSGRSKRVLATASIRIRICCIM
jgi:hypothetical protein